MQRLRDDPETLEAPCVLLISPVVSMHDDYLETDMARVALIVFGPQKGPDAEERHILVGLLRSALRTADHGPRGE